jgi:thiol-disulfide isomerase/thioredoxin
MRNTILAVVLAVAAAATGALIYRGFIAEGVLLTAAATELKQLRLPDPSGRSQDFRQWNDKTLIVNFWATWCEPCREEVPALLRFQHSNSSKGVQVVGIAVDSAPKVQEFAAEYKIAYPLVIGGMDMIDLARKFGNSAGGLPFTVIINPAGRVVATHLGRISETQLDRALKLVDG